MWITRSNIVTVGFKFRCMRAHVVVVSKRMSPKHVVVSCGMRSFDAVTSEIAAKCLKLCAVSNIAEDFLRDINQSMDLFAHKKHKLTMKYKC